MIRRESSSIDTDISSLRISAVCISRNPETLSIRDLPYHNYTSGWRPFGHEKTKERVSYLAERRNSAVAETLALFPETNHVLMIDSYYLQQEEPIRKLIKEYAEMIITSYQGGCILGASSWIYDKTRIRPKYRFYDGWTTPEGLNLRLEEVKRNGGTIRVNAVGGCYIYPTWVWEKIHYGVPEDLHGGEQNWLCEHSGLPIFLSLNERVWREPIIYPRGKRLRMSLHIGRLLGR
jgi:hypothetical protein